MQLPYNHSHMQLPRT